MATIDRLCQYPVYNSNFRKPGGQDTFKQHIKDLDTLLKDIGLVRTALENQLDVDNIDDLDISLCFTSLTSVWQWNTNQAVYYKPIEYGFNDALQGINPVTIKFEFFFFRFNIRVSTLNPNDCPYFGCKITVSNGLYQQVIWQHPFMYRNTYNNGNTFDNQWPIHDLRSVYNNRKSNVCYDKDKGYFFLMYCPDFRYNLLISNQNPPSMPLILLSVSRSRNSNGEPTTDYLRLVNIISQQITSSDGNYGNYGNANMTRYDSNRQMYYSYVLSGRASVDIYESNTQFQVPYNANTYYNNGEYYTYMSLIYNTNEKIPVYDPFILIGNKVMAGYETSTLYNIKLNDFETKKYLAISGGDTGGGYPYASSQCLLMYYN